MVGARVASLAAVVAVTLMGCEKECTVYKTVGMKDVAPVTPPNYALLAQSIAGSMETLANQYQPKSVCADAQLPQKTPPSACYGIDVDAMGMILNIRFEMHSFDPENIVDFVYPGLFNFELFADVAGMPITCNCLDIPFKLKSDKQTIDADMANTGNVLDEDGTTIASENLCMAAIMPGMVSMDIQNISFCSKTNEMEGTLVVEINEVFWGMVTPPLTENPPPTTIPFASKYCTNGPLLTTTTTTILITYECTTKVETKCCDGLGAQTWSETIDAESVADCGKWDIYYTEHGAVCNALPSIGTCENTNDRVLWEGNDTKQCQGHLDQSGKDKPDGPGCIKMSIPPKADKECLETFFEGSFGYSAPCSQTIAELIACGAKEGMDCMEECVPDTTTVPCKKCLQNVMVQKCNPAFVAKSGIGACPEVDYNAYFSKYFHATTGLWEHHAVDWKTTVSISAVAATSGLAVLVAFVTAVGLRRMWHNRHSTNDGAQAILETEDVE